MTTEPAERPVSTSNPTPNPLPLIYTDPVVQVEVRVQEYPYGRGRPGAGVQFTLSNGRDVIAARLPRESARGLALSILAAVDPAEIPAAASVVSTEGSARPRPHWTIGLGAEEARRWVASEPQMTDAEKDAFRAQVEGFGHPHPDPPLNNLLIVRPA